MSGSDSELPMNCESLSVRVCSGCLATDCRLFDIHQKRLEQGFADLTGLVVSSCLLCVVCLQLLRKFREFRSRCVNSFLILQQLHPVNGTVLNTLDRKPIEPNLKRSEIWYISCDPPTNTKTNILSKTVTLNIDISAEKENKLHIESKDNIVKYMPVIDVTPHIEVIKYENPFEDWVETEDGETHVDNLATKAETEVGEIHVDNLATNHPIHNLDEGSFKNNAEETIKASQNYDKKVLKIKKQGSVSRKKLPKELPSSERQLLSESRTVYRNIYRTVSRSGNNSDFHQLLEDMYKASLNLDKPVTTKGKTVENGYSPDNLKYFVSVYKNAGAVYNIDIDFVSISEQNQSMEARRKEFREQWDCALCCRRFVSQDTYNRHMLKSHNESLSFRCSVCRYTFKQRPNYFTHLLKSHATKQTCRECGLVVKPSRFSCHWAEARTHALSYHRGQLKHCQYCGKGFKLAKNCYLHIRDMHRDRMDSVQCLLCGDCYNGPNGLRGHLAKMHKGAAQCPSCLAWFAAGGALGAHARAGCQTGHSGCPLCGATFPTEQLMREHYDSTHAKHKCDKIRAHLACHQRLHSGVKPYECEHCGKSFRLVQTLQSHRWTHTGEKRYQCAVCQKTFRQRSHLKSHNTTHTKEKNFACTMCEKRYGLRTSLREHIRVVHDGLPPFHRNRKTKEKA